MIKRIFWDYPIFLGHMSYHYFSNADKVFIGLDIYYASDTADYIEKLARDRKAKEKRSEMHIT